MTELRHQLRDQWNARVDCAIKWGYHASQAGFMASLVACVASIWLPIASGWMVWPCVAGLLSFAAWRTVAGYQMRRLHRASDEVVAALRSQTAVINAEADALNAEAQRVRQETAAIEAGTARRRGEVQ